jgi:5-methylcytosine-specific restriction protein A
MPDITEEMTKVAYEHAKKVYSGDMSVKNAALKIQQISGLSIGSASDYIVNFKHLVKGSCYTRTMNNYATRFITESIRADYGDAVFVKALDSVRQHIDYYESLGHGRLNGIRNIYEELSAKIKEQTLYPDEIPSDVKLKEGVGKQVTVNVYERNARARKACIDHHGTRCSVCDFEFSKLYGKVGDGFIHVHHLKEISQIKKEYEIDPISDLCPVCPNCHAMLHQRSPAYTIRELKEFINNSDINKT